MVVLWHTQPTCNPIVFMEKHRAASQPPILEGIHIYNPFCYTYATLQSCKACLALLACSDKSWRFELRTRASCLMSPGRHWGSAMFTHVYIYIYINTLLVLWFQHIPSYKYIVEKYPCTCFPKLYGGPIKGGWNIYIWYICIYSWCMQLQKVSGPCFETFPDIWEYKWHIP